MIYLPNEYVSGPGRLQRDAIRFARLDSWIAEATDLARARGLGVVLRRVPAAQLRVPSKEVYVPTEGLIGYVVVRPGFAGAITRGYQPPDALSRLITPVRPPTGRPVVRGFCPDGLFRPTNRDNVRVVHRALAALPQALEPDSTCYIVTGYKRDRKGTIVDIAKRRPSEVPGLAATEGGGKVLVDRKGRATVIELHP
ncbi:MAG: hypothetical protein HY700_03750 [Gemmatimonadetes bacterium]|nr:hypothetical protein [Gemmatimonadota bacterium]